MHLLFSFCSGFPRPSICFLMIQVYHYVVILSIHFLKKYFFFMIKFSQTGTACTTDWNLGTPSDEWNSANKSRPFCAVWGMFYTFLVIFTRVKWKVTYSHCLHSVQSISYLLSPPLSDFFAFSLFNDILLILHFLTSMYYIS